MARVNGRRCDRSGCESFAETAKDETPNGWIVIRPVVAGSVDQFEVCSNRCGYLLMRDRGEADGTIRRRGRPTVNALMSEHSDGAHAVDPRDGCPLCEEATRPRAVAS